jgi:hypothetical protein
MGYVWAAPVWQGLSLIRFAGRCSHVFGLLMRRIARPFTIMLSAQSDPCQPVGFACPVSRAGQGHDATPRQLQTLTNPNCSIRKTKPPRCTLAKERDKPRRAEHDIQTNPCQLKFGQEPTSF